MSTPHVEVRNQFPGWSKPQFLDFSLGTPEDAGDEKPYNGTAKPPSRHRNADQLPSIATVQVGIEDTNKLSKATALQGAVIRPIDPVDTPYSLFDIFQDRETRTKISNDIDSICRDKENWEVVENVTERSSICMSSSQNGSTPTEQKTLPRVQSLYSRLQSLSSRLRGPNRTPSAAAKFRFLIEFDTVFLHGDLSYGPKMNSVTFDTDIGNKGGLSWLADNVFRHAGTRVDDTTQIREDNQWDTGADVFEMKMTKRTQRLETLQAMNALNNMNRRRIKSHWRRPLVLAAATSTFILPMAAAAGAGAWGPHLRIGAGFAGFSLGVVPIPLRRDDTIDPSHLIPIYILSLICTALFIALQYSNITRNRGQYLFGTFVLTAHLIGGLSQTSDDTLTGIVDLGPILLPAVAALVSLLFPRQQPTVFRHLHRTPPSHETTSATPGNAQRPEEDDIGLQPLTDLGQAVIGVGSATL